MTVNVNLYEDHVKDHTEGRIPSRQNSENHNESSNDLLDAIFNFLLLANENSYYFHLFKIPLPLQQTRILLFSHKQMRANLVEDKLVVSFCFYDKV